MPANTATQPFTFFDDTVIVGIHSCMLEALILLQLYMNELELWLGKWRIKVNPEMYAYVTFTLRKSDCVLLNIHKDFEYLGVCIFGSILRWCQHTYMKFIQIQPKRGRRGLVSRILVPSPGQTF